MSTILRPAAAVLAVTSDASLSVPPDAVSVAQHLKRAKGGCHAGPCSRSVLKATSAAEAADIVERAVGSSDAVIFGGHELVSLSVMAAAAAAAETWEEGWAEVFSGVDGDPAAHGDCTHLGALAASLLAVAWIAGGAFGVLGAALEPLAQDAAASSESMNAILPLVA